MNPSRSNVDRAQLAMVIKRDMIVCAIYMDRRHEGYNIGGCRPSISLLYDFYRDRLYGIMYCFPEST